MWNWQHKNWANFEYPAYDERFYLEQFKEKFHTFVGVSFGFSEEEKKRTFVELLSLEALETSKIEGEFFSLETLQSSFLHHFGLQTQQATKATPKEEGICMAFQKNFTHWDEKLSHSLLWEWNSLLRFGEKNAISSYRNHPVYIVSGNFSQPKIHFEGVSFEKVEGEMGGFLEWFESSKKTLSPLVRASVAHLYFVSIHPFEDGNGRISRMLSEKCLSEFFETPVIASLSLAIQEKKSRYYEELQKANSTLEVSDWVEYFSKIILRAQEISLEIFRFTLQKRNFYHTFAPFLNLRQKKAIDKMWNAGRKGFEGGMSVEKYLKITETSRATATRDLTDLVQKNILTRTGSKKGTRYFLSAQH